MIVSYLVTLILYLHLRFLPAFIYTGDHFESDFQINVYRYAVIRFQLVLILIKQASGHCSPNYRDRRCRNARKSRSEISISAIQEVGSMYLGSRIIT